MRRVLSKGGVKICVAKAESAWRKYQHQQCVNSAAAKQWRNDGEMMSGGWQL